VAAAEEVLRGGTVGWLNQLMPATGGSGGQLRAAPMLWSLSCTKIAKYTVYYTYSYHQL